MSNITDASGPSARNFRAWHCSCAIALALAPQICLAGDARRRMLEHEDRVARATIELRYADRNVPLGAGPSVGTATLIEYASGKYGLLTADHVIRSARGLDWRVSDATRVRIGFERDASLERRRERQRYAYPWKPVPLGRRRLIRFRGSEKVIVPIRPTPYEIKAALPYKYTRPAKLRRGDVVRIIGHPLLGGAQKCSIRAVATGVARPFYAHPDDIAGCADGDIQPRVRTGQLPSKLNPRAGNHPMQGFSGGYIYKEKTGEFVGVTSTSGAIADPPRRGLFKRRDATLTIPQEVGIAQ